MIRCFGYLVKTAQAVLLKLDSLVKAPKLVNKLQQKPKRRSKILIFTSFSPILLQYTGGFIEGNVTYDFVGLTAAPNIKVNYTFTLVNNASDLEGSQQDGIMGLSPQNNVSDFIDHLYNDGYIQVFQMKSKFF